MRPAARRQCRPITTSILHRTRGMDNRKGAAAPKYRRCWRATVSRAALRALLGALRAKHDRDKSPRRTRPAFTVQSATARRQSAVVPHARGAGEDPTRSARWHGHLAILASSAFSASSAAILAIEGCVSHVPASSAAPAHIVTLLPVDLVTPFLWLTDSSSHNKGAQSGGARARHFDRLRRIRSEGRFYADVARSRVSLHSATSIASRFRFRVKGSPVGTRMSRLVKEDARCPSGTYCS